jgi:preprotein translocase subunit SecA
MPLFAAPKQSPPPPELARPRIQAGRNDKCPCGSGKKFKNCCMRK